MYIERVRKGERIAFSFQPLRIPTLWVYYTILHYIEYIYYTILYSVYALPGGVGLVDPIRDANYKMQGLPFTLWITMQLLCQRWTLWGKDRRQELEIKAAFCTPIPRHVDNLGFEKYETFHIFCTFQENCLASLNIYQSHSRKKYRVT